MAVETLSDELLLDAMGDPRVFAHRVLRHDLWERQQAILRSVQLNRLTAVASCRGIGKTRTAADAALWWVTSFSDGIVLTTAPKKLQVEKLLWGEIHNAVASAIVRYPKLNLAELRMGPNNYAVGLTTNQPERFQGWHGHVLVIFDEAPGIEPFIWNAAHGIAAGGDVHFLALGNPAEPSGPFFDAMTSAYGWTKFNVSAFDTPNFAGLGIGPMGQGIEALLELPTEALYDDPLPYLVNKRWVKERYLDWGPESPMWYTQVLGQFPPQGTAGLIHLAWLNAARSPPADLDASVKSTAGVDVAGPGDDETVLVVRTGENVEHIEAWRKADAIEDVIEALSPWKGRLGAVNVDDVGIGYHFATQLKKAGYPVVGVNVGVESEKFPPTQILGGHDDFVNLKAQLYWALRERFQNGEVHNLKDDVTIGQLAKIRYDHDNRNRIFIEKKADARKRGEKSPDRAEAVMLAFARAESLPGHVQALQRRLERARAAKATS